MFLHFSRTQVDSAISAAADATAVGPVDFSLCQGILRAVLVLQIKEPGVGEEAGTHWPVVSRTCAPSLGPSLLPFSFLPLNPGVLCHLLEWSPAGTGRPAKRYPCTPFLPGAALGSNPSLFSAHHAASLHLAELPKPSCHNPRMPHLHLRGSDGICTWDDGDKRGLPRGVHGGHRALFRK